MKKLLIIKPSSLGDIIHAFPVAAAVSRKVPDARIDWLVRPEYAEIVKVHPSVHAIFLFERDRWSKWSRLLTTIPETLGLIRSLRTEKYDAVLDLQGLFRSGLTAFLSGSGDRFGFQNAREFAPCFYNRKVSVPDRPIHAIERYQLFLKEMGLDSAELVYDLTIPRSVEENIERLLAEEGVTRDRPLIVLNPNARWETKKWFPERFARLADKLGEDLDAAVIIIGGPSDVEETRAIEVLAKGRLHNVAGKTTLMQLAALLKKADLMVTCDSGPMHLAAAVGTRVIALFGPTDPDRTGPYGPGHCVLQHPGKCVPCFKRSCPDEARSCMASITVDEVFDEVKFQRFPALKNL